MLPILIQDTLNSQENWKYYQPFTSDPEINVLHPLFQDFMKSYLRTRQTE